MIKYIIKKETSAYRLWINPNLYINSNNRTELCPYTNQTTPPRKRCPPLKVTIRTFSPSLRSPLRRQPTFIDGTFLIPSIHHRSISWLCLSFQFQFHCLCSLNRFNLIIYRLNIIIIYLQLVYCVKLRMYIASDCFLDDFMVSFSGCVIVSN